MHHKVAIVVVDKADILLADACAEVMELFCIQFDIRILSPFLTPDALASFAKNAEKNGYTAIIAAVPAKCSWGADDFSDLIRSYTGLPVIASKYGRDSFAVIRILALLDENVKMFYKKFRLSEELRIIKDDNDVKAVLGATYAGSSLREDLSIDPAASDIIDGKHLNNSPKK